jgi:hypothetical protein
MRSVNKVIAGVINRDVYVQKCLKRGILNIRSLAKFLINKHDLNYSLDAVISAIRRYDLDEISLLEEKSDVFSKMLISTKDHVAKVTIKEPAFKLICEDFLGKKVLRDNFRMNKSKETITVVLNQKDIDNKLKLFKDKDILNIQKGLSELRLHFTEDVTGIKGIIARIAGELAARDINIEDELHSMPDLMIYVKEKNLVKAHETLMKIKKGDL